uniref:Metalloendopeptidase n=1 Tax=Strongyloides papillosus TaxID=174720 RepID=A0A0N5CCJ9_STREA
MLLITLFYLSFNFIIASELNNFFQSNVTLNQREKRAVIRNQKFKWKSHIFPYYISRDLNLNYSIIIVALVKIEKSTCLRFSRVFNKKRASLIYNAGPMYSTHLGKEGDFPQKIFVPRGDMHHGKIARETLRALGFDYEHNRPDRDIYISIIKNNILARYLPLYAKKSPKAVNTYGLSYDYRSIMHYGSKELCHYSTQCIKSKNKDPLVDLAMGKTTDLSFNDAKLVNLAYCISLILIRKSRCLNYGFPLGLAKTRCYCLPYFEGKKCQRFTTNFEYCTNPNVFYANERITKVTLKARRDCYYFIKAREGKQIMLYIEFSRFALNTHVCNENQHLEIRFKKDFSVTGKLVCPLASYYSFKSESNMIIIHSKYDIKYYEFTIYYHEI